ncbi:MAG TPA: shikimate kinase [Pyrinomonadaceae bacterium]|jgi:shikimate kinase
MTRESRILITGFMGAGKTTVGAALARRLDCRMLDLDEYIERREGRSVQAIIDEEGEARFRQIEARALREALEDDTARIIMLGGGTWMSDDNRALIAEHTGFTVWLDTPFELCWQRITRAGETRPLARDRQQARRLYQSRRNIYELAQLRMSLREADDAETIATEILNALGTTRDEKVE